MRIDVDGKNHRRLRPLRSRPARKGYDSSGDCNPRPPGHIGRCEPKWDHERQSYRGAGHHIRNAVPGPAALSVEAAARQHSCRDPLLRRADHSPPQWLATPAQAPLQYAPDHRHRRGRRPSTTPQPGVGKGSLPWLRRDGPPVTKLLWFSLAGVAPFAVPTFNTRIWKPALTAVGVIPEPETGQRGARRSASTACTR